MTDFSTAGVMLFAKDMNRMIDFYSNVLGFRIVQSRFEPDEFVVLDSGTAQIYLHRIPEKYARHIVITDPPTPRSETPMKVLFRTQDVDAARNDLIARGVRMGPIHSSPPLAYCDGTDPEGNIFQITNDLTSV